VLLEIEKPENYINIITQTVDMGVAIDYHALQLTIYNFTYKYILHLK
jgi:hypothetical protein